MLKVVLFTESEKDKEKVTKLLGEKVEIVYQNYTNDYIDNLPTIVLHTEHGTYVNLQGIKHYIRTVLNGQ